MTAPRPPSRIRKRHALLITGCCELLYLSISFYLAEHFGQWSVEGEILRCILRSLSIAVLLYYFLRCFRHKQPSNPKSENQRSNQHLFYGIVFLLFGFALMDSNADGETLAWQITFAFSGLLAGLREELFYRGIVQRFLQKKYGAMTAFLLGSALFTLSHWQALYHLQMYALIMITLAGVIFSSLFIFSGNVFVNVLVHGFYDALLSVKITPHLISPETAITVLGGITMFSLFLVRAELGHCGDR